MHQYDPANVKVVFGGALLTGYANDSFVSIEYNNDLFALLVGADGEAARSKSNDQSARITMRFMPGSSANLILGAALTADKAAGVGVLPLAITDLSTGTTHAALAAWVVKDPNTDYQQEAQAKEWIIETDKLESVHGASVT